MATPVSPPDRYPDALYVPRPFRGLAEPHQLFNKLFLSLFDPKKVKQLYTRAQTWENQYFITGDPNDCVHFGVGHPLASLPKYDWFIVGESDTSPLAMPKYISKPSDSPKSIRMGWLRNVDSLIPPSIDEKVAHDREYADQMATFLPKITRLKALSAIPPEKLSEPDKAELAKLKTLLAD